jgi:hypothetical protein
MNRVLGKWSFLEVEKELYLIRGDNIVDNPLFGKIRMIFYNICSYHYGAKAFPKRSIEKWFEEISGDLSAEKYLA